MINMSTFRLLAVVAFAATFTSYVAQANPFKILYTFKGAPDAALPTAGPIYNDGIIYGTGELGGASDKGSIFSYDIATKTEKVLYSLQGGSDGYGITAGLIYVDGFVYGEASGGGITNSACGNGCGTVFKIDANTGAETILHTFTGVKDGNDPLSSLIRVGDNLWGVAYAGGGTGCFESLGCGTIFKVNLATSKVTVVHRFDGTDGSNPATSLTNVGGILYGTTYRGGAGTGCVSGYGCGTAFSLDPKTGALTVLHSFSSNGSDGASPATPLIDVGGTLYGMTNLDGAAGCGGPYGCGTFFSMDPTTGVVTPLYQFTGGSDGKNPSGPLTYFGGMFYGSTQTGFEIDPETGALTPLPALGAGFSGMTAAGGRLFGTTRSNGNGFGTLFRFTPP